MLPEPMMETVYMSGSSETVVFADREEICARMRSGEARTLLVL